MSLDETYRYSLRRSWSFGHGSVTWVLLHPSTAPEGVDDDTTRRMVTLTQRAGYRRLEAVSLFAARAASPAELFGLAHLGLDIVGPSNADHVERAIADASAVVCAWGSTVPRGLYRAAMAHRRAVVHLCRRHLHMPLCIDAAGPHPCDPLATPAALLHPGSTRVTPFRLYPIDEARRVH